MGSAAVPISCQKNICNIFNSLVVHCCVWVAWCAAGAHQSWCIRQLQQLCMVWTPSYLLACWIVNLFAAGASEDASTNARLTSGLLTNRMRRESPCHPLRHSKPLHHNPAKCSTSSTSFRSHLVLPNTPSTAPPNFRAPQSSHTMTSHLQLVCRRLLTLTQTASVGYPSVVHDRASETGDPVNSLDGGSSSSSRRVCRGSYGAP